MNGEMRNAYKILLSTPEMKTQLGRSRRGQGTDNMKMSVGWTQLAQVRTKW